MHPRRVAALCSVSLPLLIGACKYTVAQSFDASGIKTVVLRASEALDAHILGTPLNSIRVSGTPQGGARGYHSPDPTWKETSAADWGLDFVAKRYGSVLVISTQNEFAYIHHFYYVDSLTIAVPPGVDVVRVARELSGDGAPDLSPPP